MELHRGWPFYPPKDVIIDNKSIRFGSHQVPYDLHVRYRREYDECPCCTCIINGKNWSPAHKIKDIVEQYEVVMRRYKKLYSKKWNHRFLPDTLPMEVKSTIMDYLC